jgi:hypothetical protein
VTEPPVDRPRTKAYVAWSPWLVALGVALVA